jgi:hypothetical protein
MRHFYFRGMERQSNNGSKARDFDFGGIARFPLDAYPTVNLHTENFPKEYDAKDLISIKSTHDQANLQITVAKGKGGPLVDVDLDENSDVLKHIRDVLNHTFTGGTDPIDIHEYLVFQDPNRDLGYDLLLA